MAIYLIQLLKFCFSNDNQYSIVYGIVFLLFLCFIVPSIYNSFKLLTPKDVAFQQLPAQFYKTIAEEYRTKENITDEELLNEYIKTSYNNQLEEILVINDKLCLDKGESFSKAFNFACISIIPYLICMSIYLFCPKNDAQQMELKNYKQIIQYMDSTRKIDSIQKK